jgi:co-chaperonin GroES (HSP10)
MDIYEISGFDVGRDDSGVNFLDPAQTFDVLRNGFVYRQELKTRLGFSQFANRLSDNTRVMGIFENIVPNGDNQLLVISKEFLYKYDSGTNSFIQIANAGSAPAGGFAIASDSDYVSGTTYLTKTGAQRFVFTGSGMSDVYYYDGTDVRSFTLDNPDYQAPAAGALTKAKRVIWFGERLNFFVPTIAGQSENQAILYSAIRNSAGNGDKFNTSGSGLLSCDTYENMMGATILGDIIVMNFARSNWTLEKTRDAFNPYFVRKVPSVLGTNAGFSAVSWDYEVKSVGRTGLISTDGRQSLRFDNKLPYFTSDNISQADFELTYGGFDRINGQFLFAYKDNIENPDLTTQDKVLVYNYEEKTWSINDQRFSVFGQTDQGYNLAWNSIDETEDPSWGRMDTTEEIWNKIGILDDTQKTLAGDNLGFVYNINTDYDDYFVAISGITAASSAVVTVSESAFQVGDRVIFENVEGMTEINGQIGTILSASTTSITVDIDSSLYTAYTSGGSVSKLIDFEAKLVPFNPYRSQGYRCYVSHLEFLLNTNAGGLNLKIYIDGEDTPFKSAELIPTTNTTKTREWITVVVNQEANFLNFDLSRESASNQTIITAIRIHTSKGGFTAG